MNYKYKTKNNEFHNICIEHALEINDKEFYLFKDPLTNEVEDCEICENKIIVEDLKK